MRIRKQRAGITLLFVVSLIVLFMLLATTFLVVSGQYLRGARSYSAGEKFTVDPVSELDQALYVLLRDTTDVNSPIRGHSLLADIYGLVKGFRGTITAASFSGTEPSQHIVILDLDQNDLTELVRPGTPVAATTVMGTQNNLLQGRVITVTSGRAKGMVGRIVVNNLPNPTNGTPPRIGVVFERASFDREAVNQTTELLAVLNDCEILVNGPAFQGKGAGYVDGTAITDAAYAAAALMPNRAGAGFPAYLVDGDLNESWDAPDYQNVWLSGQQSWLDAGGAYRSVDLPSFYRPSLGAGNSFRASLPFGLSADPNSPFDEFDVDNDGDLETDSIWVDFNFPVLTDDSGRTYKRLFAVLVRDMGGRLNLNAHSNLSHVDITPPGTPPTVIDPTLTADGVAYQLVPTINEDQTNFSENGLIAAFPRGQGWGPPEVNLRTVFSNQDLIQLRNGAVIAGRNVYGRNGFDGAPGLAGTGNNEEVERLHFYDVPDDNSPGFFDYSYGSFWDIHGRSVLLHDYNGQPRFSLTSSLATERENSEYERRIDDRVSFGDASVSSVDMPFTYGDLESVLRGNDAINQSLSRRLGELAPNILGRGHNPIRRLARNLVTTHSYDVPTPPEDLKEYLVETYGMPDEAADGQPHFNELLPHGIRFGSKMNVNFPFGNGRDDPLPGTNPPRGNGLVDEAWGRDYSDYLSANPGAMRLVDESYFGEFYPDQYNGSNIPFDHDADGVINGDPNAHALRTAYARYLYVIARIIFEKNGAVVNDDRIPDGDGSGMLDGSAPAANVDLAYWLAQWAINVVDFRDADSIMTPFEFDINPFNGWTVDGNPNTIEPMDRGVVFGCERPELLLTESFAYHDRRTEDRDFNGSSIDGDPKGPDDDHYDQRLMPFGGLMLELFNPNSNRTRATPDIYDAGLNGVQLTKTSVTPEDVTVGGNTFTQFSPVWRLVVTEPIPGPNPDYIDLDNPDSADYDPDLIERAVYFIPPSVYGNDVTRLQYGLPITPTANNVFAPTAQVANATTPIPGLGTAVVGTGQFLDLNDTDQTRYVTPLGRLRPTTMPVLNESVDLNMNATRGFVLDPTTNQLIFKEHDGTNVVDSVRQTVAIPIENLNVSEPDNGYGVTPIAITFKDLVFGDANNGNDIDDEALPTPRDEPLDQTRFTDDGTRNKYRYVHLQRLANPLVGWDAETNPYRTVDALAIDLHVFHGAAPRDTDIDAGTNLFGTRERGAGTNQRNLWNDADRNVSDFSLNAFRPVTAAGDGHFFSYSLEDTTTPRHEESIGETIFSNGYTTIINDSYDYVNNPDFADGIDNDRDGNTDEVGEANFKEFPSLTWNNRPFISQYELMLVPQTSSSQLLRQFSLNGSDNYGATGTTVGRFGHLMNFHKSTTPGATAIQGANLYQIFDYLHVPSRFTNSSGILQPDLYASNSTTFKPPYNVLPSFREPGRLNLNTISHPAVFNALKGGDRGYGGHYGDFDWFNFAASRRGQVLNGNANDGDLFDTTTARSFFANSFRSGSDGNLVTGSETVRTGVDASLLRSDSIDGMNWTGMPTPMPPTTSFTDNRAFLGSPSMADANRLQDPNRHAYLRYRNRVRLGNLTTTRSNVFAIWITVGYFEYDESTGTIGEELGKDTASSERHRAFYMIDRSIPVGFEPGVNHNVDRTIVNKRYIE